MTTGKIFLLCKQGVIIEKEIDAGFPRTIGKPE